MMTIKKICLVALALASSLGASSAAKFGFLRGSSTNLDEWGDFNCQEWVEKMKENFDEGFDASTIDCTQVDNRMERINDWLENGFDPADISCEDMLEKMKGRFGDDFDETAFMDNCAEAKNRMTGWLENGFDMEEIECQDLEAKMTESYPDYDFDCQKVKDSMNDWLEFDPESIDCAEMTGKMEKYFPDYDFNCNDAKQRMTDWLAKWKNDEQP